MDSENNWIVLYPKYVYWSSIASFGKTSVRVRFTESAHTTVLVYRVFGVTFNRETRAPWESKARGGGGGKDINFSVQFQAVGG